MFDLAGKVALVTGGNGGIGLAMARALAGAGAQVVISGRNAAKSRQAVDGLRAEGFRADAIEADVADEAAVANLLQQAADGGFVRHVGLDGIGLAAFRAQGVDGLPRLGRIATRDDHAGAGARK